MARLRILVADDSQFMRIAYRRILETQEGFEVVGMAADGVEALEMAVQLAPDVAVLDVRMPRMDGIEAAHRILGHHPKTAIVIISAYDDMAFVRELIKNRPERKAYLLKNSLDDIGELIRVVEAVTRGQLVLDRGIVDKLTRLQIRRESSLIAHLTEMERNVLELMAEAYDDTAIAATLGIDTAMVQSCADSIFKKLGLSPDDSRDRRLQAVAAFVNQSASVPYTLESQAES